MSRKRKYLPTGSRSWRGSQGGILAKLPRPLRGIVKFIFSIAKNIFSRIYNLVFSLVSKIPLLKKFKKRGRKSPLYWLNIAATIFLLFVVLSSVVLGGVLIYFSKDLPSPDRLTDRQVSMSTKIYDRNGKLLYDIYGDENRTLITLDQVSEVMKQATLAIEDKNFYRHRGFDPFGIIRGAYNTAVKRGLQGGSTLTQQLVKNTLLSPERTIVRKLKEFILAIQIEARYSKDEIFQMYFNEASYGGQAIGVQAAAENYFNKSASELSLAEAALLAGLPQAPSKYSPYRDPELAKWRQGEVLRRMREDGNITREEEAAAKKIKLKFRPKGSQIRAPHFVMYVRELLAERYGDTYVETGGLRVTTSLDLDLHNKFQKYVTDEIKRDRIYRVSNGALVATNPKTGEILSMVGSKDYFATDIDGQFNVTTSPSRQPGSSIKPINYVTAFKQGFAPLSKLIGIPTTFKVGPGQPPYRPQNFANQNYRIVSVRKALGNSLNVPAVKMLSLIGLENMLATAQDMGITTFTDPDRYGISLTLGGGEVKMVDMATAFGVFATGGIRHDPVAILKVTDYTGKVLEEFKPNKGVRVLTEQQAYLINSILSDYSARTLTFGGGNQLGLNIPGHTVAAKTGTTNDNRDNWAIGYTPAHKDSKVSIVIASWIGNNDNSPMNPRFFAGAARIWNKSITAYLKGKSDVKFKKPKGIVTAQVDALSGMAPGPYTTQTQTDIFIEGTVPTEPDNWHVRLKICKLDGKLASDACVAAGQAVEKSFIKIQAEKPEWQDDVDAWVGKTYPKSKYPQYYPPTEVSDLCFDAGGSAVNCTDPGAGPLISGVSFYAYPPNSAELTDSSSLPSNFEVRVDPVEQPGTGILSVWFTLEGSGCDADKCNWGPPNSPELVTTPDGGVYKSSGKALFQNIAPGSYTLKVEAVDDKGGVTNPVFSIAVTVIP
ncbi:MAG: hypothetical protein BMS9Abin34_347 [Patescibacteria group bacterium]|nr:MAG: hypothetical protein BMS9Abin34_347 [Patescibacteria group bacterium]